MTVPVKQAATAFLGAIALLFGGATARAQTVTPAPLTQAQVDAGREAYLSSCASCHGEDLAGKGAPALSGGRFANGSWSRGTVANLYAYIQSAMPFCQGGTLANDTYANITAFILKENGAKPGTEPLTPSTNVKVGDIIAGALRAGGAASR